jgi:hypothetical protein
MNPAPPRPPTPDEQSGMDGAERVNRIVRREAAWERYRDTTAMRRVMSDPEPGDVRLAFEAGYAAAAEAQLIS